VARTVVSRLADEISVMAITAMRRLGLTGLATPVVLGGGVITARNPQLLSGITGAGIIYLFLSRVLTSEEENLDPADYEMPGVLGRTSVPIRQGGTGEIIYSQAGTRKTCGARAEDGAAIAKGTEVIVTRYEKGIAYVRLWTEMAGEESISER